MELTELRSKLKAGTLTCTNCGNRTATDVHHLSGHHSDNHPENLTAWCKRCHDEHHGISAQLNDLALVVRQFYAIQDVRKAMSNRVQAYARLDYYVEHSAQVYDQIVKLETSVGKMVEELVSSKAIYQAWLKHVKGIGPKLSASLISLIGSPHRFESISALWAYSGVHVQDGQAPKRRKGQKANWNSELKKIVAYKVPSQFIKVPGSFGRKLYDQYKAFYEQTHDAKCPVWSHPDAKVNKAGTKATVDGKGCSRKGHINNMAMRKVGKVFLSCLWLAWRKLNGLPVTDPYAAGLPGHSHIIRPDDWIAESGVQLPL